MTSLNFNINSKMEDNILNLTNYCEEKLTNYEKDTDPDSNFFNNLELPSSNYFSIENINEYLSSLKYNLPLNILHCNCRSLFYKMSELKLLSNIIKPKIIALSETWLQSEIANLISLDGYVFIHKARENATKGGGVGFLIDNTIQYEVLGMKYPDKTSFEYLAIKIALEKMKDLILMCIYRPPGLLIENITNELERYF